jgi:hypothetical protein
MEVIKEEKEDLEEHSALMSRLKENNNIQKTPLIDIRVNI